MFEYQVVSIEPSIRIFIIEFFFNRTLKHYSFEKSNMQLIGSYQLTKLNLLFQCIKSLHNGALMIKLQYHTTYSI